MSSLHRSILNSQMELIGTGMMCVAIKPIDGQSTRKSNLPKFLLPEKIDIRKIFHQLLNQFPPSLRWVNFHKDGELSAEVLMSAEFVHLPTPTLTLKEIVINDPIPAEIRPDMRKFRLEVTFVGIRGARKLSHFASGRYKIELSMGELKLSSGFSGKFYKSNVNFLDPFASGYAMFPEQLSLLPPIIIKHLDCSHKNPTVLGATMISHPEKFFVEEKPKEMQRFLLNQPSADVEAQQLENQTSAEENEPLLPTSNLSQGNLILKTALSKFRFPKFLQFATEVNETNSKTPESEFTWWNKFYNSNRDEDLRNDCMHELTVSVESN